ncbi:YibE/F family protein [Fusobacterium nucleatum]|uniref:YibE/F family protein n=1 Tax=Fusobacterium nucleatum TaxID=851 RepID=UPI003D036B3B
MKKFLIFMMFLLCSIITFSNKATTEKNETKEEYLSGKIIALVSEENSDEEEIAKLQKFNVKLLEGIDKGEVVEIDFPVYKDNEYNINAKVGDRVVVYKTFDNYGNDEMQLQYYIADIDKRVELYIMGIIFVVLVLLIAKKNGLKAIFGLLLTIAFIIKVFLPAIYNGYSPILFAVITAIFSSLVTIYFTVGTNKKFFVALLGVISGVMIAGLLSYIFTYRMCLNGFLNPDLLASAYLLKNIKIKELIPAGVIIGSLGAVMDVSVSIASSVNELHETDPNISKKSMFKSAINIGHDIIGTMINTLILAYIASSIFTLLLIYMQANEYPLIRILNFQDIVVEIMRSICGSIGILISVPLTAYIGTMVYKKHK